METTAEHIENLYKRVRKYSEDTIELYKLKAISRVATLFSALTSSVLISVLVILFLFFISISMGLYLGTLFGAYYLGFLLIAVLYLFASIIIYQFKDKLIVQPLENLVISAFLPVEPQKTTSNEN